MCRITSSFTTRDSFLALQSNLVRPKRLRASAACHATTATNLYKLERIQRKLAALCYTGF
jgi:hypothetical protein